VAKGSKVTFVYTGTADSTFGVGFSNNFASHFTLGGSFTVTNWVGSGGSSGNEYVCGNATMPNAPILWSNDNQGR
jgi:hypothetical protein